MKAISQLSHLTESEAWRILGKLEGRHKVVLAEATGVSQSVFFRFLEADNADQKPGQNRRRATTPNKDRRVDV